MNRVSLFTVALCFALVAGGAAAQCTSSTGSVDLELNGNIATGQVIAASGLPGGTTTISLSDSGGAPGDAFILVGGNAIACQSIFFVFGGTLDVAGAGILLNGISPATPLDQMAVTDFSISYGTDCTANGTSGPALQAVHMAPAAAPYFLAVTGAAQATYSVPQTLVTVYENWGDDAAVLHSTQAACPGGPSANMQFGTVAYQDVYISSNGPLSFNGGTGDYSATALEHFNGYSLGFPGVAPRWEDMQNSATLNDQVIVTTDLVNNTAAFRFVGQAAWGSGALLGEWTCTFGLAGPGSVVIDLSLALPAAENCVVGVTDGGPGGPTGTAGLDSVVDLDVAAAAGYTTPSGTGPESICEEFGAGSMDVNVYTFIDLTGTFEWTLF